MTGMVAKPLSHPGGGFILEIALPHRIGERSAFQRGVYATVPCRYGAEQHDGTILETREPRQRRLGRRAQLGIENAGRAHIGMTRCSL